MAGASRFSAEQRARAVRLVAEARPGYPSESAAIASVAAKIGMSAETPRTWVRQAQVDGGQRPGISSEAAEGKRLWRLESFGVRPAGGFSPARSCSWHCGAPSAS